MTLTEFTEKHKYITSLGIALLGVLLIVSSFITWFFPIFNVVCISGTGFGVGICCLFVAVIIAKN